MCHAISWCELPNGEIKLAIGVALKEGEYRGLITDKMFVMLTPAALKIYAEWDKTYAKWKKAYAEWDKTYAEWDKTYAKWKKAYAKRGIFWEVFAIPENRTPSWR